jgi:uncharacterized protein
VDFDWDEGNRDKNLRHGVHDWEIEEAFKDRSSFQEPAQGKGEARRVLYGRARTSGKYLRIVYTIREREGQSFVRPISAVEMTRRHKTRYRRR